MTFLYELQLLTNSYLNHRSQNQNFGTAQPSLEIAFGTETASMYEFQLLINSYVSQSSQNWHFWTPQPFLEIACGTEMAPEIQNCWL